MASQYCSTTELRLQQRGPATRELPLSRRMQVAPIDTQPGVDGPQVLRESQSNSRFRNRSLFKSTLHVLPWLLVLFSFSFFSLVIVVVLLKQRLRVSYEEFNEGVKLKHDVDRGCGRRNTQRRTEDNAKVRSRHLVLIGALINLGKKLCQRTENPVVERLKVREDVLASAKNAFFDLFNRTSEPGSLKQ